MICKVKINKEGQTHLKGIKYEIFNTGSIQFVDYNGNGLFYSFNNYAQEVLLNMKVNKHNFYYIKINYNYFDLLEGQS